MFFLVVSYQKQFICSMFDVLFRASVPSHSRFSSTENIVVTHFGNPSLHPQMYLNLTFRSHVFCFVFSRQIDSDKVENRVWTVAVCVLDGEDWDAGGMSGNREKQRDIKLESLGSMMLIDRHLNCVSFRPLIPLSLRPLRDLSHYVK